jgi:hypothetical protein
MGKWFETSRSEQEAAFNTPLFAAGFYISTHGESAGILHVNGRPPVACGHPDNELSGPVHAGI